MISHETLSALLDIEEILMGLTVLFWMGWLLLAGLVVVVWCHNFASSVLYRGKRLDHEWSKRFYPAVLLLVSLVGCTLWLLHELRQGIIPLS